MKDFFAFRLMITAGLIKVIYPIGAIGIVVMAVLALGFMTPKGASTTPPIVPLMTWDRAILFVVFANIGWRIFCEQMILLFSIHESLNRKNDGKG